MTTTDVLFRPFRIGTRELPNRIVMAPMTRSFAVDGIPGAAHADYYCRRSEGGVGLILSEGAVIDRPASRNDPGVPFFHGDAALAGWKGVIDAVHNGGAKMGPQLWHTGALKSFLTEWEPDSLVASPSGLEAPGVERGVAMSDGDIADTIAAFARAASDAKRLGFDTIELHGRTAICSTSSFGWPPTGGPITMAVPRTANARALSQKSSRRSRPALAPTSRSSCVSASGKCRTSPCGSQRRPISWPTGCCPW